MLNKKIIGASAVLLFAIIIVAFILFGPTGSHVSVSVSSSGINSMSSGTTNLISHPSPALFIWLAFIIAMALLASVGILRGKRKWILASGVLLLLFSIVSSFSIGLFILPLAILVLLLAIIIKPSLPQDADQ